MYGYPKINLVSDPGLFNKSNECNPGSKHIDFSKFCLDSNNRTECIKLGEQRANCIAEAFISNDCKLRDIIDKSTYFVGAGSQNWNSDYDLSIFTDEGSLDIILECIYKIFYPKPRQYRPVEKLFDNNWYIEALFYNISMLQGLKKLGFTNIYDITGNSEYMRGKLEAFCRKHKITYERWANWGEYTILAGFGDKK